MRRTRISIALAVTAGLCVSAAAQAGIGTVDCTGCTTAQIEALVPRCYQGFRYITNFAAGALYMGCYELTGVSRLVATQDGPRTQAIPRRRYHWAQPAAGLQNTFQAYLDVYNNNGHVRAQAARVYLRHDLKPRVDLGADDGYMNAYDTVGVAANNDLVLNWLSSTLLTTGSVSALPGKAPFSPALSAALVTLLNSIDSSILSVDFHVLVTVVFNDGSTRDYTVDQYGDWSTVPDSAKDGHGNPIPEKYDDVADGGKKTYAFGGSGPTYDQPNFVHTLTLYGIPVSGDNGAIYSCVWDGGQSRLTCTRTK